jgi:hypothetical protein
MRVRWLMNGESYSRVQRVNREMAHIRQKFKGELEITLPYEALSHWLNLTSTSTVTIYAVRGKS